MSGLEPARLLVSACLMGRAVRYDGKAKADPGDFLNALAARGLVVETCPECEAGAPVPRPAAEIEPGRTADDVLNGRGRVMEKSGTDVTSLFLDGANRSLALALAKGCRFALLTDKSPSCGSSLVYDGNFAGKFGPGAGILAALLRRHGIRVFADHQIDALRAAMAAEQG